MDLRGTIGTLFDRAARRLLGEAQAIPPAPPGETPTPRKVLFLGGSNTVMRGGYSESLIAVLADRMGPFEKVTNLSAGANSSLHGLMLVKGQPDLAEQDLVFIEYGVNDAKLAAKAALPIWSASVEGTLRCLLANRPDRPVFFIHFARRNRRPFHNRLAVELRKLVAHYSRTHPVALIDIDNELRRVLFPKPNDFRSLYSDNAHFERPVVASLIGARIAAEVLGTRFPPEVATALPEPLDRWHFQDARLIPFLPDPAQPDRVFTNSRFTMPTRRLAPGESLDIDLPGRLICLEYIAAQDAGTLGVAETGKRPFAIHTRHKSNGAKLPFLVKSTPMIWRPSREANSGPRPVRFTALADADPARLRPEYNMIAAEDGANSGVYLSRLLCLP